MKLCNQSVPQPTFACLSPGAYYGMDLGDRRDTLRDRSTNRFSLNFNVMFCSVALTIILAQLNDSPRVKDTFFANKISKYDGLLSAQILK